MHSNVSSTERFSDRVYNYVRYRPSYPAGLVEKIVLECQLNAGSVIADVGSGTGKLTELLLAKDLQVAGVEPNREMRQAAEELLGQYKKFISVDGESASTGLADGSIDLVTAAQAFHWFDSESAKEEFNRILKPDGRIALIWNQRETCSGFQRDYDAMLTSNLAEYAEVNHRSICDADIKSFMRQRQMQKFCFDYVQCFDLASFIGRMKSSSYTPEEGTKELIDLVAEAEKLFSQYECGGEIEFAYQSILYLSS